MSITVIAKLQDAVYPDGLVAEQEIIVTPTGKVVVPNNGQFTKTLPLASIAVALFQLTTPVEACRVADAEILAGQVITGGAVSATTTKNEHDAELPAVSKAVQVTREAPRGKLAPEKGAQEIDCAATLSVAEARGYTTLVTLDPAVGEAVWFEGQLMTGANVSRTMTENEQDFWSKALSVAVHVTDVVVAMLKLLPDAGTHTVLLMPDASSEVAAYVASADEAPLAADIVISPGHIMEGGVRS